MLTRLNREIFAFLFARQPQIARIYLGQKWNHGGGLNYVYIFLPLVTNYAIYFLAFYVEALKQDPEEFRKPGPLDPGGGPYIKDGSRNSSAKPTYAQYARSGGDILAGPVLAWGLGLANAAFWPNIRSWFYQL